MNIPTDPPSNASNPPDQPPAVNVRTWERYIRGISWGVFLLAAIGLVGYATLISAVAPELDTLKRFVFFLIIVSFVLFILNHARGQFDGDGGFARVVRCVAAISILVIPLMFLLWVGAFILRDIGALSPVRVEPVSYLLRPSGRAAKAGLSYDPKTTLRRNDSRALAFHVIQDSSHMGKLEGIYAEFGPGENDIDAELTLPYEVDGKPHRVRLSRGTKTFDFID